jgi:formylglycine-generating enzyme
VIARCWNLRAICALSLLFACDGEEPGGGSPASPDAGHGPMPDSGKGGKGGNMSTTPRAGTSGGGGSGGSPMMTPPMPRPMLVEIPSSSDLSCDAACESVHQACEAACSEGSQSGIAGVALYPVRVGGLVTEAPTYLQSCSEEAPAFKGGLRSGLECCCRASSEPAGGSCQAESGCDECRACARAGTCRELDRACVTDLRCSGYRECIAACNNLACQDGCVLSFGEGSFMATDVDACECRACADACGAEAACRTYLVGSAGRGGGGGAEGGAGEGSEAGAGGGDPVVEPGGTGDSCAGMDLDCTANGSPVSCCDSQTVPFGTFPQGRCGNDGCSDAAILELPAGTNMVADTPEHDATVTIFALDTFEVTVGRFRNFVRAYAAGWRPAFSQPGNPRIGSTLWQLTWNSSLPADSETLIADVAGCSQTTWTDQPGDNELLPINCVGHYEAVAFCIWDRGWLPTEAEWERAAAGGDENRLYPWGATPPNDLLARWDPGNILLPFENFRVGGTQGVARWGHHDMAGSLAERVMDWASIYDGTPCNDCCYQCQSTGGSGGRLVKGGSWRDPIISFRGAARRNHFPTSRSADVGFRCAREAPQ